MKLALLAMALLLGGCATMPAPHIQRHVAQDWWTPTTFANRWSAVPKHPRRLVVR
jgi:starvation-inducible outer membrane lipoprotein